MAEPDNSADNSFDVRIASTGQTYTVGDGESITDVLWMNGIRIPTSCGQGVCGTCVTGVLSGEVDHRDVYFTEAEQAANDQITPCCSRARSAVLVLDL